MAIGNTLTLSLLLEMMVTFLLLDVAYAWELRKKQAKRNASEEDNNL